MASEQPTGQPPVNQERPATPLADDDSGVINIPNDQVHPALSNARHPDQVQTHTVDINGRQEQWTTEKLIAEGQKSVAAQENFQAGAAAKKEASGAIAFQEDMQAAFKDGDTDAFRRAAAQMGVQGDEVERVVRSAFGEDEDENVVDSYLKESAEAGKPDTRSRPDQKVDYSHLSPDVQRALRTVETDRIGKIVDRALDSNETLAYNMKAQSPEGQTAIRRLVDEQIQRRLPDYGGDFGDGARILAEVIPDIEGTLKAIGTPGQRTHAGLGPSPGGGDTEIYPQQLPEHVSSSEGDTYEEHILKTLNYHHSRAERGAQ